MHYKEAKGILSAQNGMNIFRGCTHGCIYCDSRSKCYQINHDFEDVEVKSNAVELLETALRKKRRKCMVGTGAMCDPYIPLENELRHTRKCIEIIERYGFGLAIQTKSNGILRDINLLTSINKKAKCIVQMTLTTYDEELCRIVEPSVSSTKERFAVLEIMCDEGIPTVVWLGPLLPFINDTEENLRGVLDYCIEAKVSGIIMFNAGLTLRDGNREYYYQKLNENFPGLSKKYHQKYGYRYEIKSDNNDTLMQIFHETCAKHDIVHDNSNIFRYMYTFPDKDAEQMSLF